MQLEKGLLLSIFPIFIVLSSLALSISPIVINLLKGLITDDSFEI